MPRVSLVDDCRPGCGCPRHGRYSVGVGLSDDCVPCTPTPEVPVPVLPVFELRERIRQGWDEDGNAVMMWRTLLEGGAIITQTRKEFDAEAGMTRITGTVTLANSAGLTMVRETAVLFEGDLLWRITKSEVFPDRMVLGIERTEEDG